MEWYAEKGETSQKMRVWEMFKMQNVALQKQK